MKFQYVRLQHVDEMVDLTPPVGYEMHSWMFATHNEFERWIVVCWRPIPLLNQFVNVGICTQVPTISFPEPVPQPWSISHSEPFEPAPTHDGHGDDGRLLAGP